MTDSHHPADDDRFEAELSRLGQGLSLPRVPDDLHDRLLGLFDEAASGRGRCELVLESDSRTTRPLVGARGSGDVAGYTLRFSSSTGIDLVVDVSNNDASEGLLDIHGLILGSEVSEASLARVTDRDGSSLTDASVDDLGRFGFDSLASGAYQLALTGGQTPLVVDIELGEDDV